MHPCNATVFGSTDAKMVLPVMAAIAVRKKVFMNNSLPFLQQKKKRLFSTYSRVTVYLGAKKIGPKMKQKKKSAMPANWS